MWLVGLGNFDIAQAKRLASEVKDHGGNDPAV
jgi:hypothetical protein